jgi:hypothetical protein
MNKTFLFLLVFSFAKCLGQDYVNNNLGCVYGKRYYQGADDAQASVHVTSHDNMIEVLVNLKDDKVFFNDALIKSDHIELWFAVDTVSRNYILWNGDTYDNFEGEPVSVENFLGYREQTLLESDQHQADDSVDSEPELISDFTGMVHWGIDLKNKTATLFDTSHYYFLEPAGSASKFITVQTTGASSYSILIRPEALGFSKTNIVSSLYLLADVFDADDANNLSILSTSVHRKWGKRNCFTNLKLSSPLITGEDLNPDNVVDEGLYFFNGNQWRYYYVSNISTDLRQSFNSFTYLPLTYDERVQPLKDGSNVYTRDYHLERCLVYPETIRKIKFRNWVFDSYSKACAEGIEEEPAPDISIEIIKKNMYAITTTNCSRRSVSGFGACGSCRDYTMQFFIAKEGLLHKLFTIDYSPDQVTVNIPAMKSFHGNVINAGWSEKYDAVIIDCTNEDYQYSDIQQSDPGDANTVTCNRYTITWDKNFNTKAKKAVIACTDVN